MPEEGFQDFAKECAAARSCDRTIFPRPTRGISVRPGQGARRAQAQHAVLDTAEADHEEILEIVLVNLPRRARALPGQQMLRAQHIAGGEVEERPRLDAGLPARHGDRLAVTVHVFEQPADIAGGKVGLERPGRVGVAECHREVGHVAEHHALVGHGLARQDRLSVDRQRDAAQHLEFQAGRDYHDVGGERAAVGQLYPLPCEALDLRGHNRDLPLADGAEEIAVRHRAHALIPGFVLRCEMRGDVIARAKLARRHLHDMALHRLGPPAREAEEVHPDHHVLPAGDVVGGTRRQ